MAPVPEKILTWLYSVLHEYHDPQRTYSDAARTLSLYPSLSPRTDVYTYENGTSALLLTFTGTLPAVFRGTTYNFPIKLWVPHRYPYEAPMFFVNPSKEMLVRPGQHVAVDGRIYHPYLRDWVKMWDRASVYEFLHHLQQVFGKETPVIGRAQQQPSPTPTGRQQVAGASPAVPPQLPPKELPGQTARPETTSLGGPPPLPPKPGEEYAEPGRSVSRNGPPLPPLPHEVAQPSASASQNVNPYPPAAPLQHLPSRYEQPPPEVYRPTIHHAHSPHSQLYRASRDVGSASPVSPLNSNFERPNSMHSQHPLNAPQSRTQAVVHQPNQYPPRKNHYQQQYAHTTGPPSTQHPYLPPHQPPQTHMKQQAPDLLTDPFEVALPGPTLGPPMPAPPIPPNPEKEHLLQAISTSLVQEAQQKVSQNLSAIAPLQAQQQALRAAQQRLEGEIRQLEQLEQALSTNEAILHRSIQDCDRATTTARSKKQPPIEEVLIAPTMVANQLWTLCAEEAACRETMYVLQKAVDRGRVSGNDFVRQMRNLGRESFLKMALARKCAAGMGLDIRR